MGASSSAILASDLYSARKIEVRIGGGRRGECAEEVGNFGGKVANLDHAHKKGPPTASGQDAEIFGQITI